MLRALFLNFASFLHWEDLTESVQISYKFQDVPKALTSPILKAFLSFWQKTANTPGNTNLFKVSNKNIIKIINVIKVIYLKVITNASK